MARIRLTLTLLVCCAGPVAAQAPVGPEFRVNTYTTGNQENPSIAVDPAGNFVVVWLTAIVNSTPIAVGAQRFDAGGALRGSEFLVNDLTAGYVNHTRVAGDASGAFTVVWTTAASTYGQSDVRARGFNASGAPRGPSFLVNGYTTGSQSGPAIAAAADGSFVVVWTSDFTDGSGTGVVGQLFDAGGARRGAEFAVNTSTLGLQGEPDVAMDGAGNFVVVWSDLFASSIGAQRFTAAGGRMGGEFIVNEPTTMYQRSNPRLTMAGDGHFDVTWHDGVGGGSVLARRLDPSGLPLGGAFVVSPFGASGAVPQLTPDGRLVVAWTQDAAGGPDVQARWFDADGSASGPPFRVTTSTLNAQAGVVLGVDTAGNTVAAWLSWHEAGTLGGLGHQSNVFAQRYGLLQATALDVDGVAGPSSNGNHVLDPGEVVGLSPSWSNRSAVGHDLAGSLSAFVGPPGATYTITDGTGSYGVVPAGGTQACIDCYAVSVTNPTVRPGVHWDAALTEVINPADNGHLAWTLHVGDSFGDVPRGSPFSRFTETVLHRGVTGGCGGSSFCPGAPTTRAQMAPFLLVAAVGAGYTPRTCFEPPLFADVPSVDPFCRWIEELARRGVTSGCGGGNYCPNDPVSREQMAVFLLRTLDPALSPPACTTPVFGDVPASSPFCRWIEELVRRGVTAGCGGGNYCPTQAVTREQMAAFLTTTFGLTLYGP